MLVDPKLLKTYDIAVKLDLINKTKDKIVCMVHGCTNHDQVENVRYAAQLWANYFSDIKAIDDFLYNHVLDMHKAILQKIAIKKRNINILTKIFA